MATIRNFFGKRAAIRNDTRDYVEQVADRIDEVQRSNVERTIIEDPECNEIDTQLEELKRQKEQLIADVSLVRQQAIQVKQARIAEKKRLEVEEAMNEVIKLKSIIEDMKNELSQETVMPKKLSKRIIQSEEVVQTSPVKGPKSEFLQDIVYVLGEKQEELEQLYSEDKNKFVRKVFVISEDRMERCYKELEGIGVPVDRGKMEKYFEYIYHVISKGDREKTKQYLGKILDYITCQTQLVDILMVSRDVPYRFWFEKKEEKEAMKQVDVPKKEKEAVKSFILSRDI